MDTTKNRKLLVGGAAAALVVGAGAVAGAAVGAGPFERDDSGFDRASDTTDATAGSSLPDSTTATLPDDGFPSGGVDGPRTETEQLVDLPPGATDTFAAGPAGFVTVTRDPNGLLRVVAVAPAAGWTFEIEPGDELGEAEVDLRNGVSRVQFNAELEDGAVRIRVRTRLGAGSGTPGTTPGTAPSSTPGTLPDGDDDSSGPGRADDDGRFDDHGGDDDSSGHGSGHDHGDDDSSGRGSGHDD